MKMVTEIKTSVFWKFRDNFNVLKVKTISQKGGFLNPTSPVDGHETLAEL